jgi:hypothetical protein
MSAKKTSRAFAQGRVKALRRMKQPMTLLIERSAPPRDPVARALGRRASGAGRHVRSQGAQRRADRMTLLRVTGSAFHDNNDNE